MHYSVNNLLRPDQDGAIWRAEKLHAGIVTDTVQLEGNPFTLPEVQTLLEGVTVGGHRLEDADQVLNQAESWKLLIQKVKQNRFTLNKQTACELNNLVAKNEALAWGVFRDRQVLIAGTDWKPPAAKELDANFAQLERQIAQISNPFIKGMTVFLEMARNQYFFDGNKRTGRLMMNGILLTSGYNVINIAAKKQQAFNEKMLRFYRHGDYQEMFEFLLSCVIYPDDKPTLTETV